MKFRIENLERRDLLTSTTLVADINQLSSQSANPREFTEAAGTTFFVANSELGTELWKTDGTADGTTIVRDIVPGADGSSPNELIPLGDLLLFHSNDQVWRTDGTEAGTFPLEGMTRIVAANSTRAVSENGFFTDGTIEGTRLLEEFGETPIPEKGVVTEEFFYLEYRTRRYVRVDMSGAEERVTSIGRADIFSLDGQVFSTRLSDGQTNIALLPDDPQAEPNEGFFIEGELLDPTAFLDVGGIGFFETVDEDLNTLLWRTDGTEAGTFFVAQFFESVNESLGFAPTVLDSVLPGNEPGEIWFVGDSRFGEEVWKSDGTVEGTGVVRDVFRGRLGSAPTDLFVEGDTLWFVANDGVSGRQIWRTDGTNDGTIRVNSSNQQLFDASEGPTILGVSPERVYFRTLSDDGIELWVTDGTSASTQQVKDIMPGANGSFPADLIVNSDGSAFFTATSLDGSELWKTDGTEAGTMMVKDIYDSDETKSSNPNNFIAFNDKLYFVANDGIHGAELWSYDGTTTSMVDDIWSGPKSSSPKELTVVGDSLFFVAEDEDSGRELYRLNRFGVTLVHDIGVADEGSNPEQLVALNDRLYFVANIDNQVGDALLDLVSRRGLWSTNGSDVKLEVETVAAGPRTAAGSIFDVTEFDGSLYFYELNETERDDILVHRFTPGDNGATDEIINVTSARSLRGFYAIQANDEFLIFAGQIEEARRDAGFLSVKAGAESGTEPVAIEWDGFFADTDTLTAIGNEFYLEGRRSYVFNGEADGAETIRTSLPIRDSLVVGETTFSVRDGGSIAHLVTGDLRTNRFNTVARFTLRSGIRSGIPSELTEWNDKLYFVVNDVATDQGTQIWSVNEQQDDVVMETSLGPERIGSQATSLFVFNDELYFSANDGATGRELWKLEPSIQLGDVNEDGTLDTADIDALFAATRSAESRPQLDLDDDADVDADDVTFLVESVLQTQFGDTNLDGNVDFSDFLALAQGFVSGQDGDWASGDLDGDLEVTFEDYLVLAENYGFGRV